MCLCVFCQNVLSQWTYEGYTEDYGFAFKLFYKPLGNSIWASITRVSDEQLQNDYDPHFRKRWYDDTVYMENKFKSMAFPSGVYHEELFGNDPEIIFYPVWSISSSSPVFGPSLKDILCKYTEDVLFPRYLTSVGSDLFSGSKVLRHIVFPNSLRSIGSSAFAYCTSLTEINFPDSLTTIYSEAFEGCTGLTSLTLPNSLRRLGEIDVWEGSSDGTSSGLVGRGMFRDCTGLMAIDFPDSLEVIGESIFQGCTNLTSLTLPNSLKVIWDLAFARTGLTSLTLPISLKEIGVSAFVNCTSLTEINFSDSLLELGRNAFANCTGLTSLTFPNSLKEIGPGAFDRCTGLVEINFPDSLEKIRGGFAFRGCTGLTEIEFPALKEIGSFTFYDCINLKKVTFPASLMRIDEDVFSGCYNLVIINVDPENPIYDSRENCNAVIHTETNTLEVGCKGTKIPASVTKIGDNAFSRSIAPDKIILPESLTYIGECGLGAPKKILCRMTNPPDCPDIITNSYDDVILFVPCGTKDLYRSTSPWFKFSNIFEYEHFFEVEPDDPAHGSVEVLEEINCDRVDYTLKVTPAEGYEFVQWSDGNTDNPRKVELTGDNDTSFVAQFNELYLLSLLSNCTGNDSLIGGGYYRYGNTVSIEAIPDSGYLFVQWSDGNTDNPRQVTVTQDTAFTAEFELIKLCTLSITYSPLEDYSVGGYASGNGTYRYGSDVTIRATPFDGYLFDRWSDGNTDNPRHVTLTQDTVFTPVFIREHCSLHLSGDHASSLDGEGEYGCGSTVTIRAYPEDGFRFDKWVRDVTEEEEVEFTTTENPYTFTLTSDMSFTAMFLPDGTATDDISLSGFSAIGAAGGIEIHRAAAPVEVYDIMGRKVYAGTDSWIALSQSGVYIVRHKEQTVKVVVR